MVLFYSRLLNVAVSSSYDVPFMAWISQFKNFVCFESLDKIWERLAFGISHQVTMVMPFQGFFILFFVNPHTRTLFSLIFREWMGERGTSMRDIDWLPPAAYSPTGAWDPTCSPDTCPWPGIKPETLCCTGQH